MYLTVKGLVLRVTDYNEHDALLSLLTREHGKLTVKARGLRRKNSPLIAACQLLTYSEFTLLEYRGLYTINEAHSIELFHPLRKDLSKLALGSYFAQVADMISQEDNPSHELQSLLLNCLFALSSLAAPEEKVKAVFELRAVCIAGYLPDLTACHHCGNPMPDRFDISFARLECSKCRSPESTGIRMPVTSGMIDAMRYIAFCDDKRLFSFQLSQESLVQLSQITEIYLTTQFEHSFSTLNFYKSLQIAE